MSWQRPSPPRTEQELLERAAELAGKPLRYLADRQQLTLPATLTAAKGQIGVLLENLLGASAGPLPEPDFRELGIELKTLPLNQRGEPKESTYVCVVPLLPATAGNWEDSLLWRKLRRVLWLPIEAAGDIPLAERRLGSAILWSPDAAQERILRQDWQELMDMVITGELEKISARLGQYLQIRPKAQHGRSLQRAIDSKGAVSPSLPRGFYLRPCFTRQILAAARTAARLQGKPSC